MIDDIFWASDNGHPLPRIQGIKDYSLGTLCHKGKHINKMTNIVA